MTIKPDNLKVEMVGTNATTVRLTHLPTRVIVQVGCYPDVERNRDAAMDGLSMAQSVKGICYQTQPSPPHAGVCPQLQ